MRASVTYASDATSAMACCLAYDRQDSSCASVPSVYSVLICWHSSPCCISAKAITPWYFLFWNMLASSQLISLRNWLRLGVAALSANWPCKLNTLGICIYLYTSLVSPFVDIFFESSTSAHIWLLKSETPIVLRPLHKLYGLTKSAGNSSDSTVNAKIALKNGAAVLHLYARSALRA